MLFFFQAEDGIRDLVRSRGLGDVYKRQVMVEPVSSSRVALPVRVKSAKRLMAPALAHRLLSLSLIHI